MIINGDEDDDELQGSAEADLIFGFAGADTIRGGVGDDTLHGGDGNDTLYGGTGNDRLFGGAGDDTLDGGVAPGEAVGDPGFNAAVYDFSSSTTSVVIPGSGPWLDRRFTSNQMPDGQGGMDTLVNIDALEIYGGSAADRLADIPLIDGLGRFTLLEGNGGNDTIGTSNSLGTVAFDTARRDLGVDRLFGFGAQDRILLRNFDFDLSKPLSTGDGTAVARGEVQFAYDATNLLTRVYVGADDVAGADLVFELDSFSTGPYLPSQFSRNDAGADAYLVMDDGISDPVASTAPRNLQGTAGNDSLQGGAGDDTLSGGTGNDRLNGGAGNDLLDGGDAYDAAVYDFSAFTTAVSFTASIDPTAGATSTQADGLGGSDTVTGIEALEIFGGSAADTLTGGATEDFLQGGAGDDVLTGGGGIDYFAIDTSRADAGTDLITDLALQDRIRLLNFTPSSATFSTGDGSAVAMGEIQFSAYDAATNTTRIFLGTDQAAGADLTLRLQGEYLASGFSSGGSADFYQLAYTMAPPPPPPPPADPDQTLTGTSSADTLTGGSGNDTISGGSGADILDGAAGNDTIHGEGSGDKLYGRAGDDSLFGGAGRDRLEGGDGHDTLVGGADDDMLWGDAGADWLQGDGGNDRLTGGEGDDFLVGGAGSDILVGNLGQDTFWFQSGSGTDRIEFFWTHHDDRIRIDADVNGSGILTADDAYARTTDTADGAVVDLGAGNTITLVGVHLDAIHAGIFEVV